MGFSEAMRDDQTQWFTSNLCRRTLEHLLGRRIKYNDALAIINDDDGIHGRRDHVTEFSPAFF